MTTPATDAARAPYAPIAIALHWAVFVLVVVVGILGLLHDDWPRATQAFWINLHVMLGLLMFVMVLARIAWRVKHPAPELPDDVGEFSKRVSHPAHMLLYALLIVIPIIGLVSFVFHGRVFDFGLFQIDLHVPRNRAIFHSTEDWHGYLAYGLFGLAGVHALAALWHHFIRKDGVLKRMLPGSGR